ncbi:MAG: hypothetical protein V8Q85_02655 [Christensenellales bacterium]
MVRAQVFKPQGIVHSEATIRRIAAMKPAASDFVLMWDNAYCVHEFDGEYVSPSPNIWNTAARRAIRTWCSSSPQPPR